MRRERRCLAHLPQVQTTIHGPGNIPRPLLPFARRQCPAAERRAAFVPGLLAPVLHFVLHKLSDDVETLKILRDYVFVLNLYAKGLLEEYD
jgi:hypothetical protein